MKRDRAASAAHSPGLARIADEVVVMDGGRVVERGSYGDLCARAGQLRDLLAEAAGERLT